MTKTIKELADELGYSKTYIMQTIKQVGLQSSLRKNGNKFLVDEPLERELKLFFADKNRTKTEDNNSEEVQTNIANHLADLRTEIANLKEQLKVKDEQIAEQNKQLDQAQQLQLFHLRQEEKLKLELEEVKAKKWYQFWK